MDIKGMFLIIVVTIVTTRLIDTLVYDMSYNDWKYNIVFFVIYALTYVIYYRIRNNRKKNS